MLSGVGPEASVKDKGVRLGTGQVRDLVIRYWTRYRVCVVFELRAYRSRLAISQLYPARASRCPVKTSAKPIRRHPHSLLHQSCPITPSSLRLCWLQGKPVDQSKLFSQD